MKAAEYYSKGRDAGGNLDRFPFRRESLKPLSEAVVHDPADPVARFQLGCLLYFLGRHEDAIALWERGAELNPGDFNLQRNLGLALYENGDGIEHALEHLERAIEIDPGHIRTFTDLSFLYSREGYFDRQLTLLQRALERAPGDDRIIEGLIATNLVKGDLEAADSLFTSHRFEQRHRDYTLRDMYRWLEYGKVARDYRNRNYKSALEHLNHAQFPPSNLGVDDFQYQSAPRLHYYRGLVLEASGKASEARKAFEQSTTGWEQLSGDRDSWNSENFYMALSLEKLGKNEDAKRILDSMRNFSSGQLEDDHREHRSEAYYLLALVHKHEGDMDEAARLMREAVQIMPDNLGPRFELRQDVPDPLSDDGVN
jgi:tetratricopeptide (TPR) repeat protein